jgi:hypothetical protein
MRSQKSESEVVPGEFDERFQARIAGTLDRTVTKQKTAIKVALCFGYN